MHILFPYNVQFLLISRDKAITPPQPIKKPSRKIEKVFYSRKRLFFSKTDYKLLLSFQQSFLQDDLQYDGVLACEPILHL